jgi:hypothetical protein
MPMRQPHLSCLPASMPLPGLCPSLHSESALDWTATEPERTGQQWASSTRNRPLAAISIYAEPTRIYGHARERHEVPGYCLWQLRYILGRSRLLGPAARYGSLGVHRAK